MVSVVLPSNIRTLRILRCIKYGVFDLICLFLCVDCVAGQFSSQLKERAGNDFFRRQAARPFTDFAVKVKYIVRYLSRDGFLIQNTSPSCDERMILFFK